MKDIKKVETIIVLMFENRSFDHMMGYLGLPPYSRPVEGLQNARNYTNDYNGFQYSPFPLGNPGQKLPDDPPHEREDIGTQMDPDPDQAPYSMRGFVRSYSKIREIDPNEKPTVLGYYLAQDVPATHFFATQYGICDHWFCALPTGTQPNRLMAMSGYTLNDRNQGAMLPKQHLIYDWLNENGISWRVYHQGIPFLMMMDDWHTRVLTDEHFCDFGEFQDDVLSGDPFPQVVFIEPRYTDAPHVEAPCDDHAPSPITPGQNFLKSVYSTLITNSAVWRKSLLIVNYDEGGGFFDHVTPLIIPTKQPTGGNYLYGDFKTTGPRVPAYLISPFVKPGTIYKNNLDHTSVLKCIARRFGNGLYSKEVDDRPVGDIWDALELDEPRDDDAFPPPPSDAGFTPGSEPEDEIPQAFAKAAAAAKNADPESTRAKFPELFSHFDNIG
jgi:phospholipase C